MLHITFKINNKNILMKLIFLMFTPLHLFLHQCYQDNTIIMVSIIIWNKSQMINIVIDVILNQPFFITRFFISDYQYYFYVLSINWRASNTNIP